jgi:uncharacterized protein YodC (DUF2158 family)
MTQFKAGDVVILKSGGPKMTVEWAGNAAMTGTPTVRCTWFDGAKKQSEGFAPEAVELAK